MVNGLAGWLLLTSRHLLLSPPFSPSSSVSCSKISVLFFTSSSNFSFLTGASLFRLFGDMREYCAREMYHVVMVRNRIHRISMQTCNAMGYEPESTDGRKIDSITTTTNGYAGRDIAGINLSTDLLQTRMLPRASRLNNIDH